MPEETDRQSEVDSEQLKLLSWGYIISGSIAACFSVIGLFYACMGIFMGVVFSQAPIGRAGKVLSAFAASLFAGVGTALFLLTIAAAIARFWTAHCIRQRRSRTFCMIVAAITCMEFPLGTALGIFSLTVLGRASVARLFNGKPGL
jgi:hypothetical protein